MTLDPISIATKGYVCGTGPNDIAIATKGYVCPDLVPPPPKPDGGDSSKRYKNMIDTSLDGLLVREDEEVLAIVMTLSKRRH